MTSSRQFFPSYRKRARSYIARLCGSCLLYFGLAVSASAQSPDYTQQLITLQNELNSINNTLGNIYNPAGPLLSEAEFDHLTDFLFDIMLGPADHLTGNRQSVSNTKNVLSLLQQLNLNVKRAGDLAGNAWWATNSAFALTAPNYARVYPSEEPNSARTVSFPQLMSRWSSMLTVGFGSSNPTSAETMRRMWYNNYFGAVRSSGYDQDNPYTWFDWMADMMRSNAVVRNTLAAYASESEAEQSLASYEESTAEEFTTNAPPQVNDFEIEMPQGLSGFQTVSDAFEDFISDLTPSLTGGDSEITVLPALSVGGISTTAYKFDFNNSIVPYCRAVMSFLWAVMCGAMMFRLLSGEWAYYCSLGRTTH